MIDNSVDECFRVLFVLLCPFYNYLNYFGPMKLPKCGHENQGKITNKLCNPELLVFFLLSSHSDMQ